MKYTRLNLSKSKKYSRYYMPIFILILLISFLLGSFIFNSIFKNNAISIKNEKSGDVVADSTPKNLNNTFLFIQVGAFKVADNANICKTSLTSYSNVFTFQDNDKNIKVLIGIFNESEGAAALKKITDNKIEASKVNFKVDTNSLSEIEICEIINAEINIINKLDDVNVKGINTDDFKKWIASLKTVDKSDKNFTNLVEIKDNALAIPSDLTKDKTVDLCTFLYSELDKISIKF